MKLCNRKVLMLQVSVFFFFFAKLLKVHSQRNRICALLFCIFMGCLVPNAIVWVFSSHWLVMMEEDTEVVAVQDSLCVSKHNLIVMNIVWCSEHNW